MVSAHHCWTLGSLLLNLYFASLLPDLWIAAAFFFFSSQLKKVFSALRSEVDTGQLIQKSNYCKTQPGSSIL